MSNDAASSDIGPVVPDYARPSLKAELLKLPYLKIAAWCGALPLFLGCIDFVLWLATRFDALESVGMFIIVGGVLLFLVGVVCLVLDSTHSRSAPARAGRRWQRAGVALLLLANFPVAAGIVAVVAGIKTTLVVTVENTGTTQINSFVITAPGVNQELGPIPPGLTRRARVWPKTDGELVYSMNQAGVTSTGTLIGYVTNGMGGRCTAVVNGPNVTVTYSPS